MSNIQEQSKAVNPMTLLLQQLEQAKGIKGALAIASDRWVKNYSLITSKKDGQQRFEAETLNYLDIVADKPELRNADNFQHFQAIMKSATTGLSFKSEGHLYPIPMRQGDKTIVKVQIGAHGKREMMNLMPEVKFMPEGVIVMRGDNFVYDKLNQKITKHETTEKSSVRNHIDDVVAAYSIVEYKDGRKVFVVIFQEELKKAKSKSKNKGDFSTWEEWPLEMCKKVTYHRAKKLYHRNRDGVMEVNNEAPDTEEETTDIHYADVSNDSPSEEIVSQEQETIETPSVEVVDQAKEEKTVKKERAKKSFID